MQYLLIFVIAAVLYAISLSIYLGCNQGMARNARGQQSRRLLFATLLAVSPIAFYILTSQPLNPSTSPLDPQGRFLSEAGKELLNVSTSPLLNPSLILSFFVALSWMVTYPLLYHLTNRRTSPDYENYMDTAFGLYTLGYLWGTKLLGISPLLIGIVEFLLLFIPLFQWVYFGLYRVCIDTNGMKILQETHINEVLEFMRSYGWWRVAAMALVIILLGVVVIGINVTWPVSIDAPQALYLLFYLGLTLFLLWYSWKQRHGAFVRTGIAQMFAEVKEYVENNHLYSHMTARRLESLHVEPLGKPWSKPSTIVMVIGESACRDFMSAFTPMQEDTTPWLRQLAEDHRHTLLFPNSYSCAMQTVPALERALTEYSQYNDKAFYESCSIVDVAHKLGYRVHWYSNQGHLGVSDTPITLVADTSDVAKWTHQQVNTVQYDEELLSFLDEIDPTQNNFVVLHLKGSHFNFMSRYPSSFTRWGEPGVQDNVVCYKNSIAYTDHVLEQFFQYGREKLNMQAMLYFSDHATEPGRRRKPNFDGFQMTRIPLFAWLSDEYIACHPDRYEALKHNQDKYFTNDLAYDLVCGLLDIRSPHFDETASLASPHYRFTRDMLLTYEGKKHISEDVGQ